MQEVEYQDIGFTHWECCKENLEAGCAELVPALRIHAVMRPGTTIKIGLLFQHRIKLFSKKGMILSCVAEHVFITDEITAYTFCQVKELLETAQRKFKEKLCAKSREEDIPVELDCTINDPEVQQVMEQLMR